jgi:hypothetical protein
MFRNAKKTSRHRKQLWSAIVATEEPSEKTTHTHTPAAGGAAPIKSWGAVHTHKRFSGWQSGLAWTRNVGAIAKRAPRSLRPLLPAVLRK